MIEPNAVLGGNVQYVTKLILRFGQAAFCCFHYTVTVTCECGARIVSTL